MIIYSNFRLLKSFIIISLFVFLVAPFACAQQKITLKVKTAAADGVIDKIKYSTTFTSDELRQKEINHVLFILYDNAYLAAVIDSVQKDSLTETVFVNTGKPYKWAYLQKGNVTDEILADIGYREKHYTDKPLYFKEVLGLQEKIISYCENNGYPFAAIKLDSIQIGENSLAAKLALTKNTFIRIDSINMVGNATISRRYLHNYLGIKPKSNYNEQQVKKISTRLKELPFLTETKPLQISFTEKSTKITLFLEKKRASQFDGIIGFLPDSKTGKILFTGDVNLKLQNSFGRGEVTELSWRSLQSQTSDLNIHLNLPFLLNTNFGADGVFKLYKKDSTFIEVNPTLGLQYYLSGGNYFKLFVNNKKLSLITTNGLEFLTALPDYADITTTLYGIGFKSEKTDYRLNPRKGYFLTVTASSGFKNIQKNTKINEALYNGIKLHSTQYNAECLFDYYTPLGNRSVIKAAFKGAQLVSESVFKNELLRIGGLRNLRGFDEESILATAYAIFTLEYRYILERNSYMYVFGDGAYYENNSINTHIHDTPYGFGAGISFETKAGIFSISYALGKQFDNPILLRSGKVHFGIVNYF